MATTATLGGITYNNDVADGNGNKFYFTDIDGWDNPNVRLGQENVTGKHGAFIGEYLYGGRPLTIKGVCTGQHWLGRRTLAAATSILGGTRTLTLTEDSPTPLTFTCEVYQAGPLRIKFTGPGSFTFELPLLAVDPRKYSTTTTTSTVNLGTGTAGAQAGNITPGGNFQTPWKATITTDGTWPGGTLRVYDANDNVPSVTLLNVPQLASGAPLVIDSATKVVTINGLNRYDLVSQQSLSWADLALTPVAWRVTRTNTTGVLTANFTWRDAYL